MMKISGLNKKPSFNNFNTHNYKIKSDIRKFRAEKRNFLKEFSTKYGYDGKINKIREEEYPQLGNIIYLDHLGATTFAKSAITNYNNDILNNLYGGPYSYSTSSKESSMRIDNVRKRILKYFSADEKEYNVIFTQNSISAIKLIGEMFPWTENSTFECLKESHNSIKDLSNNIQIVTEDDVKEMIDSDLSVVQYNNHDDTNEEKDGKITYNLFAYPAQCDYSGKRFPLDWAGKIKKFDTKNSKTLVLLDASTYVPSSPLCLSNKETSPDFVCLCFCKMFGFPAGLGALIVKTELNPILHKEYFNADTTKSIFTKKMSAYYEDENIDFLNIIALDHAFDAFERIYGNIKNVSNHVTCLSTFLNRNMRSFRHWNGQSVCTINSDRDFSDSKGQGGVLSFNVKCSDGNIVKHLGIEKLSSACGIHLKSDNSSIYCNDNRDEYEEKSHITIRLSIGAMTTIEDILIWLDFFKRHYVEIMPGKTIYDLSTPRKSKNAISLNDTK